MKRLLITGASRGIGRAIALKLAAPDVMLLLHVGCRHGDLSKIARMNPISQDAPMTKVTAIGPVADKLRVLQTCAIE